MRDSYCWTTRRRILTPEQTHIDALPTFGIYSNTRAGLPLLPHIHPGCVELTFLIKGFQCYEADGQLFHLSGYDIFVSYPDEPHGSGSYPIAINDIIWFQIDLTDTIPFFGLDKEQSAYLRSALASLPRLFRGDESLKADLTKAFYALASPDTLTRSFGQQLFVTSLYQILLHARHISLAETEDIEDAIVYILDHLLEPIKLEDIADCCHLSVSHFKMKFKEKTGITPRAFINHLKIEKAKLLLRQPLSVTEISSMLGFDTPNYFATLFKKHTGLTPLQFRNLSETNLTK